MGLHQHGVPFVAVLVQVGGDPRKAHLGVDLHHGVPEHGYHAKAQSTGLNNEMRRTGAAGKQVERAAHKGQLLDVLVKPALVPAMVAQGDRVHPGRMQLLGDATVDPGSAGRVLAVGHHDIQLLRLADRPDVPLHRFPAGAADNVSKE